MSEVPDMGQVPKTEPMPSTKKEYEGIDGLLQLVKDRKSIILSKAFQIIKGASTTEIVKYAHNSKLDNLYASKIWEKILVLRQ